MQQFETFEYAAQTPARSLQQCLQRPERWQWPAPGSEPAASRRWSSSRSTAWTWSARIGGGAGLVALVMAPDKVTYRVRPGVYMGQNDGRVTAVHEDRIELVELVPDGAGGWLERPASVALEDQ